MDNVSLLAPDDSVRIDVHPAKGELFRCGICGKKSKLYDQGRNSGVRRWRSWDWAGHKFFCMLRRVV